MASIVIFGGTGYAGSAIAAEAVRRGHSVTAVSRSGGAPSEDVTGREGSIHNAELVDELAGDADVIVVAVRADGAGLRDAIGLLTGAAARHGARLGVVGGAGSLHVSEGGPRLVDTPEFPAQFKPEALAHAGVLDELRATPEEVDWFYVSPGAMFGAYAPGTATGQYRTGGDVLIVDADGNSEISGPDYAKAFVDEIESPAHRRRRFTVAH
ncbi:MAG TPA: NAD(P)H-binding protein [Streptosporangiaceae bacterium]|nr:NAD(P)H-binding protein [Streptosporangiaceae bacterium]